MHINSSGVVTNIISADSRKTARAHTYSAVLNSVEIITTTHIMWGNQFSFTAILNVLDAVNSLRNNKSWFHVKSKWLDNLHCDASTYMRSLTLMSVGACMGTRLNSSGDAASTLAIAKLVIGEKWHFFGKTNRLLGIWRLSNWKSRKKIMNNWQIFVKSFETF